ncbi:unnamed protein product [Adineta steineri]|uniref:C2H2-type domain-containing protein n=1 Tax=Adineta steineri TaxID=433720 RepID=A0A815RID2_9BILA|nr:unnamed protein product [Adineta steineri]CAF4115721.1 unnamed protein product [Adineta steineri]
MTSNQLVLFDGDEDRVRFFDDTEQLTKIPSNCKFYIFCNEPQNLQDKILFNLAHIPPIYIRSSSDDQGIQHFLANEIQNYSFILIICGSNPSYSQEFPKIWKQYGRGKLFVKQANNPSEINLKDILNILKQHKTKPNNNVEIMLDYPCIHCGQTFHSNDDLQKHFNINHLQSRKMDMYIDSATYMSSRKKSNGNDMAFMQYELKCSLCNEDFNN